MIPKKKFNYQWNVTSTLQITYSPARKDLIRITLMYIKVHVISQVKIKGVPCKKVEQTESLLFQVPYVKKSLGKCYFSTCTCCLSLNCYRISWELYLGTIVSASYDYVIKGDKLYSMINLPWINKFIYICKYCSLVTRLHREYTPNSTPPTQRNES
jgi:hypothetical protein